MRRVRWVVMAGAMLSALALIAGCGGGSGSSDAGTTVSGSSTTASKEGSMPTHADWVKAANEICAKNHATNVKREAELAALEERGLTGAKAAALVRAGIPSVETEVARFTSLAAPHVDEYSAEEIVKDLEKAVELDGLLVKALQNGSAHELEARETRVAFYRDEFEARSLDAGLTACGRPDRIE